MSAGPYRKEKFDRIDIAPDRRPLFFSVTLGVGVLLGSFGTLAIERYAPKAPTTTPASAVVGQGQGQGRVGLEGRHVDLPLTASTSPMPEGPIVVHVWLQGCADCMTAFEAMRAISHEGGLGVPQVNVAYGSADAAWAESYGVSERLTRDPGALVVNPLGISSFTTLVLDESHVIRLVDRPDRPGYKDRVQGAMKALRH